jgi:hypothetical protein
LQEKLLGSIIISGEVAKEIIYQKITFKEEIVVEQCDLNEKGASRMVCKLFILFCF